MTDAQQYSLLVADWRRQVHRLYRAVRAESTEATPAAAHELWVAGRTELFNRHPASPRREGQQLRHADYDPSYRFSLPVESAEPDRFEVPTGTDGIVPFERIGRFELPFDEPAGLDIWWLASYGGGVFVPFRDGSAGQLTYGAGRYLLDTVKGADLGREPDTGHGQGHGQGQGHGHEQGHEQGHEHELTGELGSEWIVDLNFAYNPSCVYDPRWACPLAPAGNRFPASTPVGELLPTGY